MSDAWLSTNIFNQPHATAVNKASRISLVKALLRHVRLYTLVIYGTHRDNGSYIAARVKLDCCNLLLYCRLYIVYEVYSIAKLQYSHLAGPTGGRNPQA